MQQRLRSGSSHGGSDTGVVGSDRERYEDLTTVRLRDRFRGIFGDQVVVLVVRDADGDQLPGVQRRAVAADEDDRVDVGSLRLAAGDVAVFLVAAGGAVDRTSIDLPVIPLALANATSCWVSISSIDARLLHGVVDLPSIFAIGVPGSRL
jgi:hypothetical protein